MIQSTATVMHAGQYKFRSVGWYFITRPMQHNCPLDDTPGRAAGPPPPPGAGMLQGHLGAPKSTTGAPRAPLLARAGPNVTVPALQGAVGGF